MVEGAVVVHVEEAADETLEETEEPSFLTKFKEFCWRNYLPIGIIFSIIIGIFLPEPAVYVSERIPVVPICIVVLFFTIGLRLRLVEAKSAMKSYKEVIVALLLVVFVGPVFAINVLNQVPYFGPFIGALVDGNSTTTNSSASHFNHSSHEGMPILGPEEFRLALQIYLICPSAPATSLVMVTAANGHRGLSILVAVLGTVISVFTIPPILGLFLPALEDFDINIGQILLNCIIRILLPLLAGRLLRSIRPVKKVVKKWNNPIKFVGLSFLTVIFLVKVSETSASGHLEKVSVVNILCVVALGTSFAVFNLMTSYGFLSILPWFSARSTVTMSILTSIRVVGLAASVIDVLPEDTGDKGLLVLPMVFIYLATVLILNGFVVIFKAPKDEDEKSATPVVQTTEVQTEKVKTNGSEAKENKYLTVNSKTNEVAVFSIYDDEISVQDLQL